MNKKVLMIIGVLCFIIAVFAVFSSKETKVDADLKQNFYVSYKCASAREIQIGEDTKYFSQCFCMVSDDEKKEPMWFDMADVNHIEFTANTTINAQDYCEHGCEELCKKSFAKYLSENPDFELSKRW